MVVRAVNCIFAGITTGVACGYARNSTTILFRTEGTKSEREKTNSSTRLMHWISLLLLGLTAGLFLYIMVLETFLTDSQLTARTFNMSVDDLRKPALNTVMKNLGVYNGLVGAGLLYALLFLPTGEKWRRCSSLLALSLRSTGLFLLNLAFCLNKGRCLSSGW